MSSSPSTTSAPAIHRWRYLKDFTVDTLKIDRSFVRNLANDARNDVIVESIVTLARNLGLSVTAEGIERAEDSARLAALGCHRGQGYLYAKPLDCAALTTYLAERPRASSSSLVVEPAPFRSSPGKKPWHEETVVR